MDNSNDLKTYFYSRISEICKKEYENIDDTKEITQFLELSPYNSFTSKFRASIPDKKIFGINKHRILNNLYISICLLTLFSVMTYFYNSFLILIFLSSVMLSII